MTADVPRVAVIVLNWNAWADTIECLEGVLRLDYPNFEVILLDNGSTDGSAERLERWAAGALCGLAARKDMAAMTQPPVQKPVPLLGFDGEGGPGSVTFVRNGSNLGFAGGNNVGLRLALARGADFAWLLNADAVPDPGALAALVDRMEALPRAGLCGSLLCYYDAPDRVQEAGGCAWYPLVGMARRLAAEAPRERPQPWRRLEARLGYVSGASCLASRAFIEEIGLLSESYFLYCEEIDWATRGRGRFALALAEDSVVYHKKGLVTGSKSAGRARSAGSSFYLWRARMWYTRRYHPLGIPGLFTLGLVAAAARGLAGDRAAAGAILRGLVARPVKDSNPRPAD